MRLAFMQAILYTHPEGLSWGQCLLGRPTLGLSGRRAVQGGDFSTGLARRSSRSMHLDRGQGALKVVVDSLLAGGIQ